MRVAIVLDMEGTSHIGDMREVFPAYEEYWRVGRKKLTADVAAAARGLLDGGTSEVLVFSHHGAGDSKWPNVIEDDLPDGARSVDVEMRDLGDHADAMLQVGAHARGGSPSFLSHTICPGIRLRLDGELLSESHEWAYTAQIPVLGIIGSDALERERGSLSNVPFLAVQRTSSHVSAEPAMGSQRETEAAISDFARRVVADAVGAPTPTPATEELEASLHNGNDAADAMQLAGWTRTSGSEFRIVGPWRDLEGPIDEATDAAFHPYDFMFDDLDPSSAEAAIGHPRDRWGVADAILRTWAQEDREDWFLPSARLEGITQT